MQKPIVISVFSQKGGVGKTTTAVNLAASLAKKDFKVLVVDIDPQGNASTSLGVSIWDLPKQVKDILLGDEDINETVKEISKNLFIIPSNILLADQEITISGYPGRELLLRKALRKLDQPFDFVLIDCPPSVGVFSINALMASQHVLIPVDMSFLGLMGVQSIERTITNLKDSLEHDVQILGVLATQYDVRNKLTKEVWSELESHFEEKLFQVTIPLNVRLKEAPSHGQSIFEYDSDSPGAVSYLALADEVLARVGVSQKVKVKVAK